MPQIPRPSPQHRPLFEKHPRNGDHRNCDKTQEPCCPGEPESVYHLHSEEREVGGEDETHEG
jgi:hypothetical protein